MIRELASNDFFIVLILICLVFIALAKAYAPKRFNDFTTIIGNFKYLKIYARDQKFLDNFDALLFINLIINIAIFIFIAFNSLISHIEPSLNLMFKLGIGIGVFVLIKVLLERLIGSLFEIDGLIDKYLFQKISYKNFLGLVLIPINILLLFTVTPKPNIIYGVLIFILIVNIVGLVASYKSYQNLIKHNLFYFILYLCALEIAPYIILFKVFKEN